MSAKCVVLGSLIASPFTLLLADDAGFGFRVNATAARDSTHPNPLIHRENHFHNSRYYSVNHQQTSINGKDREVRMTPGHVALAPVGDSFRSDHGKGKITHNHIGQTLRYDRQSTQTEKSAETFGVLQRGTTLLGGRQDGAENHGVAQFAGEVRGKDRGEVRGKFPGENARLTQKLFSTENRNTPLRAGQAIEDIKSRRGSAAGQDNAADEDTNRTQQVVQVLEQKIQSLSKGQATEIAALRKEIQRLITLVESKGMSDLIPKLKPLRFI